MPLKKSKVIKPPEFQSKAAPNFSEVELATLGVLIGEGLKPGDRVLLDGPMGAGKSTLARSILEGAGVTREAEGSPTFPIAHEYVGSDGRKIVHVDFYRLKSEREIEETGLLETFWDPSVILISEWTSQFPDFYESVVNSEFPVLRIQMGFVPDETGLRRLSFVSPD